LFLFPEKLAHLFETADESTMTKNKRLYANTNFITNFTLNHPNVQQLLKSNEKFDLIILELYLNDALLGLGQYYKCPLVGISTLGLTPWVNELIGSPTSISHNPHVFLPNSANMGFFKRMSNFFHHSYERTVKYFSFDIGQQRIYQTVFPNPKPSFDLVRSNSLAVTLLNSHYSSSFSHAYLPNVIEVGGMQISPKRNPLPEVSKKSFFFTMSVHAIFFFFEGNSTLHR
jgi:glucuronosyltransferase